MSMKDTRWAELSVYWDQLGDEECEILLEAAEVLVQGQRRYGTFDLVRSEVDYRREAEEEDRDWLIYRTAAMVQERKERARHG